MTVNPLISDPIYSAPANEYRNEITRKQKVEDGGWKEEKEKDGYGLGGR